MRFVLLGPPGAGKGTQAELLSERFEVPHVATGELLRFAVAWRADIGMQAKPYMDAGELVPDEVVLELLRRRLSQDDAQAGFVLDGFPRNEVQAKALDEILMEIGRALDAVVQIEVPDELIVLRLSARASCSTCGRTYNLLASPPRAEGRCDIDGTALYQRDDDGPEVILNRLGVFHRETAPVVAYYELRGLLRKVDGAGDVEEVSDRIAAAVVSAGRGARTGGAGAQ